MPLFAQMVATLFGALSAFLAKLFVAKLAIRVAGVAAIVAIGAALMTTFNNYVAPLVGQLFSTQYGQFLGLAFPPISGTCIAAIAGVWAACTTYALQKRAIVLTANL
jgi:hypothetical protein